MGGVGIPGGECVLEPAQHHIFGVCSDAILCSSDDLFKSVMRTSDSPAEHITAASIQRKTTDRYIG